MDGARSRHTLCSLVGPSRDCLERRSLAHHRPPSYRRRDRPPCHRRNRNLASRSSTTALLVTDGIDRPDRRRWPGDAQAQVRSRWWQPQHRHRGSFVSRSLRGTGLHPVRGPRRPSGRTSLLGLSFLGAPQSQHDVIRNSKSPMNLTSTPNQALQRTPGFGVQLPCAAVVRPAQSRAVLPAMKPAYSGVAATRLYAGTARAFASRRRAHSRAPGPESLSFRSLGGE